MIEDAYQLGEAMGLSVWCTDQAGPFQTVPQPGQSWCPEGRPARRPHEYIRNGTAKVMTLFRPADGQVRVKGVTTCTNEVLHGWLKEELTGVLAELPTPTAASAGGAASQSSWRRWQEGLSLVPTLPAKLPPLRMLLIMDIVGNRKPDTTRGIAPRGGIASHRGGQGMPNGGLAPATTFLFFLASFLLTNGGRCRNLCNKSWAIIYRIYYNINIPLIKRSATVLEGICSSRKGVCSVAVHLACGSWRPPPARDRGTESTSTPRWSRTSLK